MRILEWSSLDAAGRRAALARPALPSRRAAERVARAVIAAVKRDGDAAVRAFTERFDRVRLGSFAVLPDELAAARATLRTEEIAALERAIANVQRFHQAQAPKPLLLETEPGIRCEQLIRPIEAVGLYVPAGSAPLPSAVVMLAVPARIAGCARRVLCTPPRSDGSAHPGVLAAAVLCGIDQVFTVGGAQAIAALAYGTESIPRVDKIFGPGNAWVTAAKTIVSRDPQGAACDLPAGPSEVLVVADRAARAELVAADLLAQAEHDPLAQALLVTDSRALAEYVAAEIALQCGKLSRSAILAQSLRSCRAIVVPDLAAGVAVVNEYAPEHLLLQLSQPRRWLGEIRNAGAIFIGPWSAEPLGDYCAGPNHVLPTYGHARTVSGLSVRDFVKTMSVQELSPAGLRALGPTAVTLAGLEGLDGHGQAVTRRLAVLDAASAPDGLACRPFAVAGAES